MARLPNKDSRPSDYSRFSFSLWEGLNPKYHFYVERWRRTLEFLRDQHWKTLTELRVEALPKWRKFPLQNYTLAFYNDYLTDYLKSEVRFSAVPASADPHDIDSAELAEQVMKYLWDHLGMDRIRIDLAAWLLSCGTAALRIFWDTNTGNQIPFGVPTADGGFMPLDPQSMQPTVGEPFMVDAGEIGVEVVSPQFVRWAESSAHGVMVGLLMTREEVGTLYGEQVAERLSYSADHEGISADLNQIQQPGAAPHTSERTLLIEHYLPRSARHPQGLWWTAANNGATLVHQPWPLPGGVVPVVGFRWIPAPGEKYIGLSPLYGMTFQNKMYEELLAKIMEWYTKATPKRLLISGGGISQGDLTDEPYQEVPVNQGAEPQNLDVDDAPQGLFRMLQLVQGDMQVTSGRAFEGQDELPEGLATARIRAPAEMKTSKAITTALHGSKAAWKEVGETLLHYVGEFYTEPRVVAIYGPDKGFQWQEFSGENLKRAGSLAATVMVDDIPLFPQNRQNLRDTVVALLQTQAGQILFAGPDGQLDMDRISGALQATGLDVNLNMLDPDVLEARNEEMEFKNWDGQSPLPEPKPWQNDIVHYDSHTLVLKSRRFRAWPQAAQDAFLQHVQATEEQLNARAEEEAQAMVEQEQQLRRVREQEELRADVMKEWAVAVINLIAETTSLETQDIMGLLDKSSRASLEKG